MKAEFGHRYIHRKPPGEDRGRDGGDGLHTEEKEKLGERPETAPSLPVLPGNNLADSPILNFWPPELGDNQLLLSFMTSSMWESVMAALGS